MFRRLLSGFADLNVMVDTKLNTSLTKGFTLVGDYFTWKWKITKPYLITEPDWELENVSK